MAGVGGGANAGFVRHWNARPRLVSPDDTYSRLVYCSTLEPAVMVTMNENVIAKLAARQRGIVTARQLNAVGFDRSAIRRRCRAGRLHRLHRGVYLVGHAAAPEGAMEMAALLACGPGSVISHGSAARLWGLTGFRERIAPVDVTIAGRELQNRPGIRIHGSCTLGSRDVRRVAGMPATAPARTLLDLVVVLPFDDLELAFLDAKARGLLRDGDMTEARERNAGRRGANVFQRLIELDRESGLTRSEAERKLLALVHAAALPRPKANARIARLEVDFLWPEQKVVVEVDGYTFHAGARAFERDRERDAILAARGYVVLRVTWRQLVARREAVIARLAAALSLRDGQAE